MGFVRGGWGGRGRGRGGGLVVIVMRSVGVGFIRCGLGYRDRLDMSMCMVSL